jgi:hypothetical protein
VHSETRRPTARFLLLTRGETPRARPRHWGRRVCARLAISTLCTAPTSMPGLGTAGTSERAGLRKTRCKSSSATRCLFPSTVPLDVRGQQLSRPTPRWFERATGDSSSSGTSCSTLSERRCCHRVTGSFVALQQAVAGRRPHLVVNCTADPVAGGGLPRARSSPPDVFRFLVRPQLNGGTSVGRTITRFAEAERTTPLLTLTGSGPGGLICDQSRHPAPHGSVPGP